MSGCSRTIVVVDDDHGVLDSIRFMLEFEGYSVATYDSAAGFLLNCPTEPCCLIVDHHMPGMTGLDLVSQLHDQGDKRRIMLITAALTPDILRRAQELGIDTVLEKPLMPPALLKFVGEATRGAS